MGHVLGWWGCFSIIFSTYLLFCKARGCFVLVVGPGSMQGNSCNLWTSRDCKNPNSKPTDPTARLCALFLGLFWTFGVVKCFETGQGDFLINVRGFRCPCMFLHLWVEGCAPEHNISANFHRIPQRTPVYARQSLANSQTTSPCPHPTLVACPAKNVTH